MIEDVDIASMAPGTLIDDRYRVKGLLGTGGMSVVYHAHDEQLGREVALKLFRPATVDRDDERRRQAEVTILATLEHPTLVTLFDARLDAVPPYLTTEFVGGDDLGARLRAGALPADDLVPLTAAMADALAFMHQRGVVHRDVKPANILLPSEPAPSAPFAKLADFGISRLVDGGRSTATGSVIGTAAYLSPEQASGRTVGPPSDIYSLGLVLIECISGARPFPGTAVESAVARLTLRPDIPEGLPSDWHILLTRMTQQDPSDRPTAAELFGSAATLSAPDPGAPAHAAPDTGDAKTLLLPSASSADAATELLVDASSADAATELLVDAAPTGVPRARSAPRAPAADIAPQAVAQTASARGLRRPRRLAIGITVAALVAFIVIVAVIWSLPHSSSAGPVVASPYPSVSGGLGQHLAELQRSVTP
jgi:serine/threonine protein kinase